MKAVKDFLYITWGMGLAIGMLGAFYALFRGDMYWPMFGIYYAAPVGFIIGAMLSIIKIFFINPKIYPAK